jgi:acetoacetyl-CoA synthetase
MNETLWTPDAARVAAAHATRFMQFVNQRCGAGVGPDYGSLLSWSLAEPERFWAATWDYCGVVASRRGDVVLADADRFPRARWFPGALLNFAENLLRHRDDRTALVSLLEDGTRRELTYAELYRQVARVAAGLRQRGVGTGDRVAGFMPNVAETVVAMLATTSIGATWTSCSPDFGADGVLDRFGQVRPKVLFSADGYYYNGKARDSLARLAEIARRIDGLEHVAVMPLLTPAPDLSAIPGALPFADFGADAATVEFAQLPFDHPLYVMYSSGTTGAPKCIVHGAGGTLLQHLKEHQLMSDLGRDDVFFYFTTCGWMMWNWLVSGLATGATVVLYDGSPFANGGQVLLDMIDQEKISVFGTSARYIAGLEKDGHRPVDSHNLGSLKTILSTGSPLAHESFEFVYRDIKRNVCLSSISGGTDILGCFVGGCPILPVRAGEIQAVALGMAVEFRADDGRPVVGEKGELVCTQPFPSCPLGFWDDTDGSRFRAAYFERFPGAWAHGDYGEITPEGGVIIYGRSDAVLNPGGVRIGTAEIYRQVGRVDDVLDSIAVGQEWDGDVRVVLFVVLRDRVVLTESLRDTIRRTIRKHATPRHVPAKIIQVTDIPRTISGKIVELAVRNVIHGRAVVNKDALANPEALDLYRALPDLQH